MSIYDKQSIQFKRLLLEINYDKVTVDDILLKVEPFLGEDIHQNNLFLDKVKAEVLSDDFDLNFLRKLRDKSSKERFLNLSKKREKLIIAYNILMSKYGSRMKELTKDDDDRYLFKNKTLASEFEKEERHHPRNKDLPHGFVRRGDFVGIAVQKTELTEFLEPVIRSSFCTVCANIKAPYQLKDLNAEKWKRVFEFKDQSGILKQITVPLDKLRSDAKFCFSEFAHKGFYFNHDNRSLFFKLACEFAPKETLYYSDKKGWTDDFSAYCTKNAGYSIKEDVRFYLGYGAEGKIQGSTLHEFNQSIGRYAVDNPNIMISLLLPLCGPMLALIGHKNFGVHFHGSSSCGKTTLSEVMASVSACDVSSWRTTDNALESTALNANDQCLILDEIGQCKPESLSEAIYMLGNGEGKKRMSSSGETADPKEFRLIFQSNGELTLKSQIGLSRINKEVRAGQQVRVIELPCHYKYGAFHSLHDKADGVEFSSHLMKSSKLCRGIVFDSFMKMLMIDQSRFTSYVTKKMSFFQEDVKSSLPVNADGQVHRVVANFSLIAAVGELASSLKIFDWPEGEPTKSMHVLLKSWISSRGGTQSFEYEDIKNRLKDLVLGKGSSKFEKVDRTKKSPSQKEQELKYGKSSGSYHEVVLDRIGFKIIEDADDIDADSLDQATNDKPIKVSYIILSKFLAERVLMKRIADSKDIMFRLISDGYIVGGEERRKVKGEIHRFFKIGNIGGLD